LAYAVEAKGQKREGGASDFDEHKIIALVYSRCRFLGLLLLALLKAVLLLAPQSHEVNLALVARVLRMIEGGGGASEGMDTDTTMLRPTTTQTEEA